MPKPIATACVENHHTGLPVFSSIDIFIHVGSNDCLKGTHNKQNQSQQ